MAHQNHQQLHVECMTRAQQTRKTVECWCGHRFPYKPSRCSVCKMRGHSPSRCSYPSWWRWTIYLARTMTNVPIELVPLLGIYYTGEAWLTKSTTF